MGITKYKIEALTSAEELASVRAFWEREQKHPAADFEFVQLVLKSRKNIESLCVFVVREDQQPVTLLVGRIEQAAIVLKFGYASLGRIPLRRLTLVEGGLMGSESEEIWSELLTFVDRYLTQQRLDLASIEHIPVLSPRYKSTVTRFNRSQLCPGRHDAEHWLLRFPNTWAEFMASRSKKRRYWFNRLPKVLDRDFPAQWEMRHYTSSAEALEFAKLAEEVARKTYHRSLGVGFHANDETIERIAMEAKRGQLGGYILFIKNEPKAFWYCFRYGNTLFLTSTGYDPAFRNYEIGTVLLLKVFQDNCGSNVTTVDFGLGDAEYKQKFGTDHFLETTLLIFSRSWRGRFLNGIQSSVILCNATARKTLDRLKVTQRLKTLWRRGKAPKPTATAEEGDSS